MITVISVTFSNLIGSKVTLMKLIKKGDLDQKFQ